ncbi:hypothetical protein D9M68_677040 [compost metagenome]
MLRRRGRQADEVGIEILQHLPPQAIDGAVAFVGDNEVEGLDGDLGVVGQRRDLALFATRPLVGRGLFISGVQLLAAQHRVEALNGCDNHLGIRIDAGTMQVLDDVGVGEAIGGADRLEVLELLERLVA